MPSQNPRVNLTLTPEAYDLLSRLAKLNGTSRSAVLVDLFEMSRPVFEKVVVVGEAAQRAKVQANEGLKESMERAEAAILPHVEGAMGQLDMLLSSVTTAAQDDAHGGAAGGRLPQRSEAKRPPASTRKRRQSPRPVTRGPGRGSPRGLTQAKRVSGKGARKQGRRAK